MCNSCGDRGEPFVTTQPHPTSDEIPDAPGKWYRPLELSWWDCDIETADDEGAENRLSLADVQKLHEKFTKRWRSSIEYQKLRTFFNEVVLNLDAMQITSCMCLCLGSMTQPMGCSCCNWSLSQLVAFESWIEILSRSSLMSYLIQLTMTSRDEVYH